MSQTERAYSLQAAGLARIHRPWPAANSCTKLWSAV